MEEDGEKSMWMRIFMDMRRVGMIVVYMPRNVIFLCISYIVKTNRRTSLRLA